MVLDPNVMTRRDDRQSRVFYELSALILNLLRNPPAPIHLSEEVSFLRQSQQIPTQRIPLTKITPAGFALLLLGISLSMMLCGSITFFLGFLLMPWVLGLVMVFYVVGIVSSLVMLALAALENKLVDEKKVDFTPVGRSRNVGDHNCEQDMGYELGSLEEEFTIVTCHKPNKPFTKVYHSGKGIEIREKGCIFNISPARFGDDDMKVYRPSGFLNLVSWVTKDCKAKAYTCTGKTKFLCSPECRSRQIAVDERPEKYCSSQACSNGRHKTTKRKRKNCEVFTWLWIKGSDR